MSVGYAAATVIGDVFGMRIERPVSGGQQPYHWRTFDPDGDQESANGSQPIADQDHNLTGMLAMQNGLCEKLP